MTGKQTKFLIKPGWKVIEGEGVLSIPVQEFTVQDDQHKGLSPRVGGQRAWSTPRCHQAMMGLVGVTTSMNYQTKN